VRDDLREFVDRLRGTARRPRAEGDSGHATRPRKDVRFCERSLDLAEVSDLAGSRRASLGVSL
jgi:hypothetical protein